MRVCSGLAEKKDKSIVRFVLELVIKKEEKLIRKVSSASVKYTTWSILVGTWGVSFINNVNNAMNVSPFINY